MAGQVLATHAQLQSLASEGDSVANDINSSRSSLDGEAASAQAGFKGDGGSASFQSSNEVSQKLSQLSSAVQEMAGVIKQTDQAVQSDDANYRSAMSQVGSNVSALPINA